MRFFYILLTTIMMVGFQLSAALAQKSAPDPIEGVWLTKDGDSHVEISKCEKTLCSKIIWLKDPNDSKGKPQTDKLNKNPKLRGRPVLGMPVLESMYQKNKNVWHGKLYKPRHGKLYGGYVRLLNEKSLEVKGCHSVFPICKTQYWKKISNLKQ